MKLFSTLVLACLVSLTAINAALANDHTYGVTVVPFSAAQHPELTLQKNEWISAKDRMDAIDRSDSTRVEKCQSFWEIEWPLAKSGNVYARAALYFDLANKLAEFKNRPNDISSRIRDILVLYFNGLLPSGDAFTEDDLKRISRDFNAYIQTAPFLADSNRLKNCMHNSPSYLCGEIAAEEKLLPSFPDWAAEIDASNGVGAKAVCTQ